MSKVVTNLGIYCRTLQRWVNWYRKGGMAEVRHHRQGQGEGRRFFLTPEQQMLPGPRVVAEFVPRIPPYPVLLAPPSLVDEFQFLSPPSQPI
jgi:hypothetical protein